MGDDLFSEGTQNRNTSRRARSRGAARRALQPRVHVPEADRRFQVFVSSTYRDLRSERQEVIQALLELECIPAGMEMFLAADEDQWSLIENVIDDCDYYVLIIGGRYGSMTQAGVSYTEREYDYAVSKNVPILAFLHEDPQGLPARDVDVDPQAIALLEAFREKARTRPIRTFATPAELGSVVSRSLVRLMKRQPGEGWVRGRFAVDPAVETEVASLRARVAELELELERTQAHHLGKLDKSELEAKEELAELSYEFGGRPRTVADTRQGVWRYRWAHLFKVVGPALMEEAQDAQLASRLASDIHAGLHRMSYGRDVYRAQVTVSEAAMDEVKLQLRAMGLIEPGRRRRPGDGHCCVLGPHRTRRERVDADVFDELRKVEEFARQ